MNINKNLKYDELLIFFIVLAHAFFISIKLALIMLIIIIMYLFSNPKSVLWIVSNSLGVVVGFYYIFVYLIPMLFD